MRKPDPSGSSDNEEVMAAYSRAQALADGLLVDVSGAGERAGFMVPVAMTASVWGMLNPSGPDKQLGQTFDARLSNVFDVLRATKRDTEAPVYFEVVLVELGSPRRLRLKADLGRDDDGKAVLTIMLPFQD